MRLHQSKLQACANIFPFLVRGTIAATAATLFAVTITEKAIADPPPLPDLPNVYCFRIIDIKAVVNAPQSNTFDIQFEVLNWTNLPATNVEVNISIASTVFFNNAGVNPATVNIPGNFNASNNWSVTNATSTAIKWASGTQIDAIDLIAGIRPSFILPGDLETIDNGTNVLNGFKLTVDNWSPGKILSFNWQLKNGGNIISAPTGGRNSYGFGVVNIARADTGGIFPGPVYTNLGNIGFAASPALFFNNANIVDLGNGQQASFGLEFAGGVSAPEAVPETTSTLLASGLALALGGFLKQKYQKTLRKVNE